MAEQLLTDDDCACLDRALEHTAAARDILDKCRKCGLPVDEVAAENARIEAMASGLKREFFPGRT